MIATTFDALREIILQESGIELEDGKQLMLSGRIRKRLRALGLPDEVAYVDYLQNNLDTEIVHLLDAVSTNVTHFFREEQHFEFLREHATRWLEAGQTKLRIWSAASSTGEEPYTLAITLDELARSARIRPNVRILATDISTRVLERARAGVYLEKSADQVPPDVRDRCFERDAENGTLSVRQHIKDYVLYRRLNLSKPPFPMRGPLDTVFCRNVMFYFNEQVKENLVTEIAKLLKVDGLFMLGMAESLAGNDKRFRRIGPSAYARTQEPA